MSLAATASVELETPPNGCVHAFRSHRIAPATDDDIPAINDLGADFMAAAEFWEGVEFCKDTMAATLGKLIAGDASTVLAAKLESGEIVGMAAGMVYPAYFNVKHLIGSELFWYVTPEHRGKVGPDLLRGLEDWARAKGCERWFMAALASQRPEAVERLYGRWGYRAAETTFVKGL